MIAYDLPDQDRHKNRLSYSIRALVATATGGGVVRSAPGLQIFSNFPKREAALRLLSKGVRQCLLCPALSYQAS